MKPALLPWTALTEGSREGPPAPLRVNGASAGLDFVVYFSDRFRGSQAAEDLRAIGWRVLLAKSAATAMINLEDGHADRLLTDDLELAREAASLRPRAFLIVVCGSMSGQEIAAAKGAQADVFVEAGKKWSVED